MAIQEKRRMLSAGSLNGSRVCNMTGDHLGEIKELMIDLPSGRVAYAVLSFGGWFGLGDKLFAIPWEALRVSQEDHVLYLNVSQEKLEQAPGFDKHDWPDMADPAFGTAIYSYYGCSVYWE